jgi:hypothetical protein
MAPCELMAGARVVSCADAEAAIRRERDGDVNPDLPA